ncbi:hypothetical protein [Aquitalea sp.]|uniref:hypothetical protein n=1 Tax=Aquitalea sp. TaxID=1872623 RepID=UPI00258DB5E6|nr:hypothetical protein [Aquitalea sp.]
MITKQMKVHIPIDEVKQLADLGSIQYELGIAKQLCELALIERDDTNKNAILIDGLVTAAVIRYVRCFHNTGKRFGLAREDVPKDLLDAHDHLKKVRDKHVAHSVNTYEQPYVSAYIELEDGIRKPFTMLLTESERVIFNKNNAGALHALIEIILEGVEKNKSIEHDKALIAVNKLDECLINSFTPWAPMEVDPSKVGAGRK